MVLSVTSRIAAIGLALLACSSNPEQPEQASEDKCNVGAFADIQAVSCYGETCMVCTKHRCRTWTFGDCR